ncbi:flagellar motor protein MotB [Pseudohaliea sp.]|uniref:flagellar motor protein MotB n=1 Tax=Pseudohaliea sp. TaxID=2740289 RepID=UPI0032EC0A77
MIDFEDPEDEQQGAPAWMATFADLMSLLMCFFVLLLSFSEMDVEKYKQIAGSMKLAFGVQNRVKVDDIPKGTSVIAREFSPGKPEPTIMDTINQVTQQNTENSLQVGNPDAPELDDEQTRELLEKKVEALLEETKEDAEELREILAQEVQTGKVDIETEGRSIIVRIRENGSFPSGSATLNTDFLPVMDRLREALLEIPGTIAVEGHTDDVPISGGRFRSNWDLSASRALSVTHELLKSGELSNDRLMVVGYAETEPFTNNESPEGRAMNRRVELVIRQSLEDSRQEDLDVIREANSDVVDVLELDR